MSFSRLRRFEERKQKSLIFLAIIGSLGLVIFAVFFGLKLLIGFSVAVDNIRGRSPTPTPAPNSLEAPIFDPVPESTNSASLRLTGRGTPSLIIKIYLNEKEIKSQKLDAAGILEVFISSLKEGANSISARQTDGQEVSDLSNVLNVNYEKSAPILELSTPPDGSNINGDVARVEISGKTEESNRLTVNDRLVIINNNGTFSYSYPLNEGENKLTIVATDPAGNQTKIERTVTYHK